LRPFHDVRVSGAAQGADSTIKKGKFLFIRDFGQFYKCMFINRRLYMSYDAVKRMT
jgi:hypothetical protein